MFLGAIFRTVKGGYDAVAIRKKIKDYNEELAKDLLESFVPYEQFLARERMLLAEYMIDLSKLKAKKARIERIFVLRERVNRYMKEMVQQAEQELEAKAATKLDIARVVNSLRELSIAVDRDFNNLHKEYTSEQKKIKSELNDLDVKIAKVSERLETQCQEHNNLKKRAETVFAGFDGVNKSVKNIELNLSKYIGLIWGFNIFVVIAIICLIWWR